MGITRLNVYAGLAGLYVIGDDNKTEAFERAGLEGLLLNATRDVPLAFMDKFFSYKNDTGDPYPTAPMIYPVGISDGGGGTLPAFSILPETFGNWMSVNGVIYPYHNVLNDEGPYLFRLLNACDSRFLRLYFERDDDQTRLNFTVVANDQGMLTLTLKWVNQQIHLLHHVISLMAPIFPRYSGGHNTRERDFDGTGRAL